MRRFARSGSQRAFALLLGLAILGGVPGTTHASISEAPLAPGGGVDAASLTRRFDGVWYRTPEKRGKIAAWLASGDLTVGETTIAFESKKMTLTIPTENVKRVLTAQFMDDPINTWILVEYSEEKSTKTAAFKGAGLGRETGAIQAALLSKRDVVYATCVDMEAKRLQAEGQKDKSEIMAQLGCQISRGGCRQDPDQEGCKNTLRELDACLKESGSSMLHEAAMTGRTDTCRTMIALGGDPNSAGLRGWTPLMAAAAEGHQKTVVLLLDAGADPNAKNELGRTALMFASNYGLTAVVRDLLGRGADPNRVPIDDTGWTALMAAADSGHIETVRALLSGGADPAAKDRAGKTALELARTRGHSSVARLLEAPRPDQTDPHP